MRAAGIEVRNSFENQLASAESALSNFSGGALGEVGGNVPPNSASGWPKRT